jgi:hypothetical protein
MRNRSATIVGDHTLEPLPRAARVKEVLAYSLDEIVMGRNIAGRQMARLDAAVKALSAAFADGRFAEIKQASETVRDAAQVIATTSNQIEYVADGLVTGCVHQLRRSRS